MSYDAGCRMHGVGGKRVYGIMAYGIWHRLQGVCIGQGREGGKAWTDRESLDRIAKNSFFPNNK
jgi:hypothetical protein